MKVHIIGGGPAGLHFAVLMKKLDRDHEVILFDRASPGEERDLRGTLFPDSSFSYLGDADQAIRDRVASRVQVMDHLRAAFRGVEVAVRVGRMAALGRKALLEILGARAQGLGAELRFETEVEAIEPYRDCDLLVGADGLESRVREALQAHFSASVEPGATLHWRLATAQPFPEPKWILAERDGMRVLAHAWQFAPDRSSFIVECREDRFRESDLASLPDGEAAEALSHLFRADLRERPLSFDGQSWTRNRVVRTGYRVHENVVLLGSAASAAHFALDWGFRRALEDAAALANALRAAEVVATALDVFESERKQVVDREQRAEEGSLRWIEDLLADAEIDTVALAYEMATRIQNLTRGDLQRLDPPFVAEYERRQVPPSR